MVEKVAVIGLGYVGLPVALAFARAFPGTIGFDIDVRKVDELRRGHDRTGEHDEDDAARHDPADDGGPRRARRLHLLRRGRADARRRRTIDPTCRR